MVLISMHITKSMDIIDTQVNRAGLPTRQTRPLPRARGQLRGVSNPTLQQEGTGWQIAAVQLPPLLEVKGAGRGQLLKAAEGRWGGSCVCTYTPLLLSSVIEM